MTVFLVLSVALASAGEWDEFWIDSGLVPDRLDAPPEGRAFVRYPSGVNVFPNDDVRGNSK